MSAHVADLHEKLSDAVKLYQQGELQSAKEIYEAVLEEDPEYLPALHNLSHLYRRIRAYDKAIEVGQKLMVLEPGNASACNNLALTYEVMGDLQNALLLYQKALKIDPTFTKVYNNIAVIFYRQRRYLDGIAILELALQYSGEDPQTLSNLGAFYNKAKRYEDARKTLERALALAPEMTGAYVNLGNVYNKLQRHFDALACHVRALESDPASATNHANLAITYKHLERYDDAIASFQRAIDIDPDFVNAHFDFATTWLVLGDYKNGFREYEWRFKKGEMQSLMHRYAEILKKPKFTLSSETKEKTLLLWSEQGYGDMIHFIRFAKPLKEMYPDLKLKVHCRDALVPLFKTLPFLDEVISRNENPGDFDYQYAIMSLPYLLEIDKEHIPNKPYIPAQDETLSLNLHPHKYNIGLVWGGSVTGESYPEKIFSPADFSVLMDHIDIDLFSLQVGEDAQTIKKLELTEEQIVDLSPQLTDFQKTASAIQQLDLVITSDTSVAHLAGAMGKEVWILLMKKADWRWGLESMDTVWYPKARLFRQKEQGKWDELFEDIFDALEQRYYIEIPRRENA